MNRKAMSMVLCTLLGASTLVGCSSAETADNNVKITVLNTKDEIQTQWEELAEE